MTVVSLYIASKKQTKQIDELERRIIEDGHELLDEHKFIGRASLEKLRAKVVKNEINRIYFYSPNHLSKKFAGQINLLREFWQSGSEVIFLNNQINDPNSRLLEQLQWAKAEYKREKEEESEDNGFSK